MASTVGSRRKPCNGTGVEHTTLSPVAERLVLEHRWLVHDLARKHMARGWAHRDLVAAGYLGLVKAARRFEDGDFVPYAATAVRREMLTFLKECAWPVRLPRNQRAPAPSWSRVGWHEVDAEASLPAGEIDEVAELAPRVVHALERIPEPWRQTLRLFYLHDHGMSGLARRFRITLEGVRTRLRRGRDLVRREMALESSN